MSTTKRRQNSVDCAFCHVVLSCSTRLPLRLPQTSTRTSSLPSRTCKRPICIPCVKSMSFRLCDTVRAILLHTIMRLFRKIGKPNFLPRKDSGAEIPRRAGLAQNSIPLEAYSESCDPAGMWARPLKPVRLTPTYFVGLFRHTLLRPTYLLKLEIYLENQRNFISNAF
jgi:hypothetical protein